MYYYFITHSGLITIIFWSHVRRLWLVRVRPFVIFTGWWSADFECHERFFWRAIWIISTHVSYSLLLSISYLPLLSVSYRSSQPVTHRSFRSVSSLLLFPLLSPNRCQGCDLLCVHGYSFCSLVCPMIFSVLLTTSHSKIYAYMGHGPMA